MSDDDGAESEMTRKKSDSPLPRRRPKKIVIPRRTPSVVVPGRRVVFVTADKTTCGGCTCFPHEDPYAKPKKLNPCQHSPVTLYELAALVVDSLRFPEAFTWREEEVAAWMAEDVGLPEYRECVLDNHIDGMRLLLLEDPSHLPEINIHYFDHIQRITSKIHQVYGTEFIRFARSVGLPPRLPLTHCTWFKSRTGPSWGIRKNWTRSDILRWMKIIMPVPLHMDHWDLVWYHKPDFPKTMFARIPKATSHVHIPHYAPTKEVCTEYLVPRKFRFQTGIPDEAQVIWMERRTVAPKPKPPQKKKPKPKESTLVPKKISLTGLTGKDLILARRKMPTPKFLA